MAGNPVELRATAQAMTAKQRPRRTIDKNETDYPVTCSSFRQCTHAVVHRPQAWSLDRMPLAMGAVAALDIVPARVHDSGNRVHCYRDYPGVYPSSLTSPLNKIGEMEMTTYYTFTENNDWEGEIWNFYIPIEGNEVALDSLKSALGEIDEGSPIYECYELDMTPLPESEVDTLVRHSRGDYMAEHNKLSGTLTLMPETLVRSQDADDDPFYKGGIRDYMRDEVTGSFLPQS